MNAREVTVSTLLKTSQSRGYSNIEVDSAIRKYNLTGAEKSFFTALFYGVIERKITLDYFLSLLSDRKLDDIDPKVLIILETGLYQLRYMDRVPESAAVNESVKLCTTFFAPKNSNAFVNAVLRSYLREKDNLVFPEKQKDILRYLSVFYSVPEWICRLWCKTYGEKKTEKILESFSKPPFLTLRVNTLKTTKADLQRKIEELGIPVREAELAPTALRLSSGVSLSELDSFKGLFFVQDEASQAAVLALGPVPGDTLLDCCACPGGKSAGCAIECENKGKIYSFDLHRNKLSLIEKTAADLGITILETDEQNGTVSRENMPMVDKILCDVPCSGLGVLSKKPDIRYKTPEETANLPKVQAKILETNAGYLKKDGVLVYSTCTLNPAENQDVIREFLKNHPDFELQSWKIGSRSFDGMTEILPYEFKTDGFFIAKLHKKG